MPIPYGTIGIHTDDMHTGSSKRDTASGLAALDSSGYVLGKGARIKLPRSGANVIGLMERTAGEDALTLTRIAANDYDAYVVEGGASKQVQTESMKDVASGIAGLDAQKLIGGGNIAAFNLLKIYHGSVFVETLVGTGDIVESLANGTLQATCPANNDDAQTKEIVADTLTTRALVITFKVNSITLNGASTSFVCGMTDSVLTLPNILNGVFFGWTNGTGWVFRTVAAGAATDTAIAAVSAGDVFTMYLISTRAMLFKNGAFVALHITNIPAVGISRALLLNTIAGQGAGSEVTLGFMG